MFSARRFACFVIVMTAAAGLAPNAAGQGAPPSPAALFEKAVDDAIIQGGATAGLSAYERWAAGGQQEHPRALRAVARATLREAAPTARAEIKVRILQALMAEGDAEAAAALNSDALLNEAGAGMIAATGSERAITQLIAQLDSPMSNQRKRAIEGLAASKSPRAVNLLINVLQDPNMDIRMAAAKALGQLQARQAAGPLKLLLADPVFGVKYEAAAALFGLGDMSALPFLREMERSQEPGIRLAAAQAMRSRPDTGWLTLVRGLTTNSDAEIRRQAAELLAPHDAATARAALEPLLASANVFDRSMSTAAYIRTETDLTALRRYLRDAPSDTRVEASLRLLDLTR